MTPAEIQAEYLRRAGPKLLEVADRLVGVWPPGVNYLYQTLELARATIAAATPPTCQQCQQLCLDPFGGRCSDCWKGIANKARSDASLQDGAEGWRG